MHLLKGVQTHYMRLNGHTTHVGPVALFLETEPSLEMSSLIKKWWSDTQRLRSTLCWNKCIPYVAAVCVPQDHLRFLWLAKFVER